MKLLYLGLDFVELASRYVLMRLKIELN